MSFDDSVLICDEVDPILNKILQDNGLKVSYEPEITPEQILEKISTFNIVIVRSRTTITKEMIDKADNCKIIARVGVGLDNVDQEAAKAKNIRVNCLSPGGVLDDQPSEFISRYNQKCLSKGMLSAIDLVGALNFLISDGSLYLNGQNIIVDDGFHLS